MNRLTTSRRLAYVFGVLTPLAETLRRWGTWWDNPPAFLDDFLLGALLIAGALATRGRPSRQGTSLLAAAWGFALGMAYSSIAFHWHVMRSGQSDPAPIPTQWVFGIKVFGGLVFAAALFLAVTYRDSEDSPDEHQGSIKEGLFFMSKEAQSNPISFSITYDGKSYAGHYTVSSGLITVNSLYGSKNTQLGGTPAHLLANTMLRELLDEAKVRGEL